MPKCRMRNCISLSQSIDSCYRVTLHYFSPSTLQSHNRVFFSFFEFFSILLPFFVK